VRDYANNVELRSLIALHSLPSLRYDYPDGWMAPADLAAIYNVARGTLGAVLEIGPWLGRSTCAICAGLRDSAVKPIPFFDVIDFGITGPDEWQELFGVPFDPTMANGVAARAIYHPGGTNAVLVNNLKRNELLKFTTSIIRGNFLQMPTSRKYDFVFCDTAHDETEAALYLPKISSVVNPGAWLIFDDVIREDLAEYICSHFNLDSALMTSHVAQYGKLLVFSTRASTT
jgi:hypothetical protein